MLHASAMTDNDVAWPTAIASRLTPTMGLRWTQYLRPLQINVGVRLLVDITPVER